MKELRDKLKNKLKGLDRKKNKFKFIIKYWIFILF